MRETESIGELGVCSLVSFIHLLPKEKWKECHPAELQYCWNFSDDNSWFLLSLNWGELIRHSRPSLKWGQKATLYALDNYHEYTCHSFPQTTQDRCSYTEAANIYTQCWANPEQSRMQTCRHDFIPGHSIIVVTFPSLSFFVVLGIEPRALHAVKQI